MLQLECKAISLAALLFVFGFSFWSCLALGRCLLSLGMKTIQAASRPSGAGVGQNVAAGTQM
jgi:hypothetical protein